MNDAITYQHIREHLASITNPVIFELGMFDGYHTKMLLSWCRSAPRYYGFEPDPRNVPGIHSSELLQWINFRPDAVGHVTGKVNFYMATPEPNGCAGSSSLSELTDLTIQQSTWLRCLRVIQVQSWRLDDFCAQQNVDHIDFIWMDVQGAERFVFEGAPEMLKKTRLIWTEYDGSYKDSSTISEIKAQLSGWTVLVDTGGDVLLRNTAT